MSRRNDDLDIEVYVLHDLMERVRNYLAAGRRHAETCDAILRDDWRRAYWTFMVCPSPQATEQFEDLDAERELRGLKAPDVEFSRRDRARIHRNVREAAANPEVRARIEADYWEFHRQWHGPGH